MIKVKIRTYCFHCGKQLKQNEIYTSKSGIAKNIHTECKRERQRIAHYLKKEKLSQLMEDPVIKQRMLQIDENIKEANYDEVESKFKEIGR